jgi:hypothetical protein
VARTRTRQRGRELSGDARPHHLQRLNVIPGDDALLHTRQHIEQPADAQPAQQSAQTDVNADQTRRSLDLG